MPFLDPVLAGFQIAFSAYNLLACFIGVLAGTLTGVLPGLGAPASMAVLLSLTYGMDPTTGIIMLAGIYYGAQYGGSTTAILLNIPGEEPAIITTIDGYQMTLKGRGGAALTVCAVGSWIAGTIGVVGLMFFAPAIAMVAVSFGPAEYFSIALFGLIVLPTITSGSPLRSYLMIILGLMMGTVGMDSVSGGVRFGFNVPGFSKGLEFVVVAIGLFGLGEVFHLMVSPSKAVSLGKLKLKELYPSRSEWRRSVWPWSRGTILGFVTGLIPGPSATLASMLSYVVEKRVSKHPEEFGKGAIEGVAGPEAANNSAASSALIPLLSLGIPFAPPVAVLLSGLLIHGITPGPTLIANHPDIFWGLVCSMYIGNVMLLILNLPLIGLFISLLTVPARILMPVVALVSLTGAYSINNSFFDVFIAVLFGLIGYLMRIYSFEPIPLVIGLILEPVIEQSFRQALSLSDGNFFYFIQRPLSALLLLAGVGIILLRLFRLFFRGKQP